MAAIIAFLVIGIIGLGIYYGLMFAVADLFFWLAPWIFVAGGIALIVIGFTTIGAITFVIGVLILLLRHFFY